MILGVDVLRSPSPDGVNGRARQGKVLCEPARREPKLPAKTHLPRGLLVDAGRAVASLRAGGGPTNIARHVVAVDIDAVERMAPRRAASHVKKEVLKRLPAVANSDAAPAVTREALDARIATAIQHRLPDPELGCPRHAVLAHTPRTVLCAPASARHDPFANEIGALDDADLAAIAPAFPPAVTATASPTKDHESSEASPSQITNHYGAL